MSNQKPLATGVRARCPLCGRRDVYVRWSPEKGEGRGRMTLREHKFRGRTYNCLGSRQVDAMDVMLLDADLWTKFGVAEPVRPNRAWEDGRLF